ncbi:MAG TPA: DoxX family protein, partial [Flavobacterium sp.]|nr:DoxX family protein [Flavobacterium sp.]
LSLLTRPTLLPHWWQDALLIAPRLFCGYLLSFDFGAAKFGLPWSPPQTNLHFFEVAFWFPNDIAEHGGVFSLFPAFLAWMGAFAEGVGGLALILGLQTRIFSFLIVCTMLVTAFVQHAGHDLWQQLPALAFLFVALQHMVMGGGRFSIDYLLTKKSTS